MYYLNIELIDDNHCILDSIEACNRSFAIYLLRKRHPVLKDYCEVFIDRSIEEYGEPTTEGLDNRIHCDNDSLFSGEELP